MTIVQICGCTTDRTRMPMTARIQFEVDKLPPVPKGVGGAFSGVWNETLVVAGGSYFEQPPPTPKTWTDRVIALGPDAKNWIEV